jgi:ribonuclease R
MVDLKKTAFMARRIGEEYDGTITGVARHGFYVTPDPFFVEGLVHVSRLPGWAELDERAHAIVLQRSGERFRLGDRVRVRVDAVDRVRAWISFALVARLRGEPASARA